MRIYHLFFITALLVMTACCNTDCKVESIGTMPDIEKGYEMGVSACYAATAEGRMLLAGGCNFPETPAAEGGAKRYYKGIYSSPANVQWTKIGELPEPSAYGVSLQYGKSLIIAGGMNSEGAFNKVYILTPNGNNCDIKTLPSLPCTIDNAAGAVCGNRIYIAGGNADGKASSRVFTLNVENPQNGWYELEPFPDPGRVQPICAATENELFVWSGFTPKDSTTEAKVHCGGYRYDFATKKWTVLPEVTDLSGTPLSLSGGTAITCGDKIFAAGGVNRTIFEDAISGRYSCIPQKEYMHQEAAWYKFNDRLLCYDTKTAEWSIILKEQLLARAGALLTTDGTDLFYFGGELKPGIRTPDISKITLQ